MTSSKPLPKLLFLAFCMAALSPYAQVTQVELDQIQSGQLTQYNLTFPGFTEEALIHFDVYSADFIFTPPTASSVFFVSPDMEIYSQVELLLNSDLTFSDFARALPVMEGVSPASSLPFSPSRESGLLHYDGAIHNDISDFYDLDVQCHCDFISPFPDYISCGGVYDWWCNTAYNVETYLYFQIELEGNWHSGYIPVMISGNSSAINLELGDVYFQSSPGVIITAGQLPVDCPSDATGDGMTDVDDFLAFNSAFGTTCSGCPEDMDGNDLVDVNDFLILNSAFGQECE